MSWLTQQSMTMIGPATMTIADQLKALSSVGEEVEDGV